MLILCAQTGHLFAQQLARQNSKGYQQMQQMQAPSCCSSTVLIYAVSCDASCSAAIAYNSTTATQWSPTFCWQESKSVYFSKSWSRVSLSNKINRFSQILRKHGYRFFLWTSVSPVIKSFGTEQSRPTSTNKCEHFYRQQMSILVKSRPNAPFPIFNVLTTVRVGLQISATWHVSSVVPRTSYHTRSICSYQTE